MLAASIVGVLLLEGAPLLHKHAVHVFDLGVELFDLVALGLAYLHELVF